MKYKQSGINMIELLVVIVIVSIIIAAAVPSYRTYMIRSRISQSIANTSFMKDKVMGYYFKNGSFPSTLSDIGLSASDMSTDYTQGVTLTSTSYGSYITITLNASTIGLSNSNANLALAIREDNGNLVQRCGQYSGSELTDVDTKYLPSECNDTDVNAWINASDISSF